MKSAAPGAGNLPKAGASIRTNVGIYRNRLLSGLRSRSPPPNAATVVWTRAPPAPDIRQRSCSKPPAEPKAESVIRPAIRRRCEHRLPRAGRDASALGLCWLSRRTRRQSMMSTLWRTLSPRTAGSVSGGTMSCTMPRISVAHEQRGWRRGPEKSALSVANCRPAGSERAVNRGNCRNLGDQDRFILAQTVPAAAASKKATNSMACEDLDQVTACPRPGLKTALSEVSGLLPRSQRGVGASCSPGLRRAARVGPYVAGELCSFPPHPDLDQPSEAADDRYNRRKLATRAQTSLLEASP